MLRVLTQGKYQNKGFLMSLPLRFYLVRVLSPHEQIAKQCDFIAFCCMRTGTSPMSSITWEFKVYHVH